ncbi:hypothetical protein J2Y48_004249 [Mycoplana sp. BE70]|nr:hypothetical protein [Mycoplana sp. BE70]
MTAPLSLDVGTWHRSSQIEAILREWCQEQEVEFTGWGDLDSRKFYGIGVLRGT